MYWSKNNSRNYKDRLLKRTKESIQREDHGFKKNTNAKLKVVITNTLQK
jgi:hypothetical protein